MTGKDTGPRAHSLTVMATPLFSLSLSVLCSHRHGSSFILRSLPSQFPRLPPLPPLPFSSRSSHPHLPLLFCSSPSGPTLLSPHSFPQTQTFNNEPQLQWISGNLSLFPDLSPSLPSSLLLPLYFSSSSLKTPGKGKPWAWFPAQERQKQNPSASFLKLLVQQRQGQSPAAMWVARPRPSIVPHQAAFLVAVLSLPGSLCLWWPRSFPEESRPAPWSVVVSHHIAAQDNICTCLMVNRVGLSFPGGLCGVHLGSCE